MNQTTLRRLPRLRAGPCRGLAPGLFPLMVVLSGAPLAAAPISARVSPYQGRPTLYLNDQPTLPLIYALTHSPGARWSWEEVPRYSLAQFAARGVRLFQADLWLEQMWTAVDKFDITLARRQIRGILDACPDAAVMLRLHVNSPPWWNRAHPEECVQYDDGPVGERNPPEFYIPLALDLERVPRHSLASPRWLRDCGAKVRELCEQLAKTPEGDALCAIQVAAGVFGEWHYYGFISHEPDVGPAMTAHFREWLRARYGTDEALRTAWNDSAASLAQATVPGHAERAHTSDGYFRDPAKDRKVIDYYRCQHEAVTDAFVAFCRIVKAGWPRPIVTGGFHGYWFTMFGRMTGGGHLEVRRALDSPYVDFLCAPQSYHHGGLGEAGLARGLLESCRLHGKLWLDEMDQAPEIWDPRIADRERAMTDSIAVLRRSVMAPFSRGAGMWYYDLLAERPFRPAGHASGWWDHPQLQEEISRLREIATGMMQRPDVSPADVLLVFDTASFYLTGHDEHQEPVAPGLAPDLLDDLRQADPVTPRLLDEMTGALSRAGAAFDMIYLADLGRAHLPQYKIVIFANAFQLDAAQRKLIANRVARDGRHLFWFCAPGYCDGTALLAANIAATVGMGIDRVHAAAALVTVAAADLPAMEFGIAQALNPLLVIDDPAAVPLGRIKGSTHVALARKQLDGSTSWFSSVPIGDWRLLGALLRQAGAHLYDDQGDVLYAGGGVLTVHTVTGGQRVLVLRNGKRIETNLPPRSTTLLDAETGEDLLPPLPAVAATRPGSDR